MEEKQTAPETEQTQRPETDVPGAERKRPKFPAVGDVLAMLGIFFVAQFVGEFAAILLGLADTGTGQAPDPAALGKQMGVRVLIAYVVTLAGVLGYRNARGGVGRIARFSLRGFNPMLILWGFLLILAVGVVIEPLLGLLPAPSYDRLGTGVWSMAALVLFAPVFEELICRGVVLESLRARYGVLAAWFVSSLFFAIIHLQPQQVVSAFFIGLIFAFLYIRTDSIWITMILHALNNALAYLLLATGSSSFLLADLIGNSTLYALVYIAAAALCAVSGVMVWRTLRRLDIQEKNRAEA